MPSGIGITISGLRPVPADSVAASGIVASPYGGIAASLNAGPVMSPRPAIGETALVTGAMPGSTVVFVRLHPLYSVGVPNGDIVGSEAGEDGTSGITDNPIALLAPMVTLDIEVVLPIIGAKVALPIIGADIVLPVIGAKVVLPVIGADIVLPVIGTKVVLPSRGGAKVTLPTGVGAKVTLPTIGTEAAIAVALAVALAAIGHVMIVPSAVPGNGPRFPSGNGPRLPRLSGMVPNGVVVVVDMGPETDPTWAAAVPQPSEIAAIIARGKRSIKSLLR